MNPTSDPTATMDPFPFSGDPSLHAPITDALRTVLDPELGISIVDLGLVYGVDLSEGLAHVRLTMTSAGCPLSDLIFDDIDVALGPALPPGHEIEIELCWEPPWTPDRMSTLARERLGW